MTYAPGDALRIPVTGDTLTGLDGTTDPYGLYRDGTRDAAVTVTVTGSGNDWLAALTIPAGYSLGDMVWLKLLATTVDGTYVVTSESIVLADPQAAAAAAIADAGLATAAQVAALAVIPTASVSETPTAGTITIRRGDYLSQSISGVGDISARTYLWFTAKTAPSRQADSAARIQITEAGGLVILNGEAYATAADGDLTVDESAETVTIVLSAEVTAALSAGQRMEWDLQILDATGKPETIATGTLTVTADVTRATEEPT